MYGIWRTSVAAVLLVTMGLGSFGGSEARAAPQDMGTEDVDPGPPTRSRPKAVDAGAAFGSESPGSEPTSETVRRPVLPKDEASSTASDPSARAPESSVGFRFGVRSFQDEVVDFIFEDTYIGGIDWRFHANDGWLGAKLGLEVGVTTRDEIDATLVLVSGGFSFLVGPPIGSLGDQSGSFFFHPYVGAGIDATGASISGAGVSASDTGLGFHALAGAELALGSVVSFGGEFQYTFASVGGVQFGGPAGFGILRFHWGGK